MRTVFIFLTVALAFATNINGGIMARDYARISERNAFRLSAPQKSPQEVHVKFVRPKVSLQGVTALLDVRQALLRIQSASRLGLGEVSCILAEGEVREGVKVLQIGMDSGTVRLANHGAEQVLSLRGRD